MPYITSEKVSQIREQLKTDFPGWKFSVRREKRSTVVVSVLEAPYDLMPANHPHNYAELNHYNFYDNYQGQALIDLQHIKQIATTGQDAGHHDSDYGLIPDWYFDIQIGTEEKRFHVNRQPVFNPKPSIYAATAPKGDISIIDYTEKSIVVIGNSTHIKELLSKANGRWNSNLKNPIDGSRLKGWVFPKTKREIVENIINENS